ncbi:hypothetical protein [Methylobacterium sp. E-046]|uniref:hypothetical protein n=1 Tax=Methylobacterium sp. E-046 TaxID=2836576 RepID=UPI001FBA1549|nr:hypothetical protein [Methylobacterium sp. E-046]MCJ2101936.1 hypothetical protein [Methylobacterium sp. E-046]
MTASKALWRRPETSLRISDRKYAYNESKPPSPTWSLCGALHVAEAATSRLPIFDPLEILEKIGDFNQFSGLHFINRGKQSRLFVRNSEQAWNSSAHNYSNHLLSSVGNNPHYIGCDFTF